MVNRYIPSRFFINGEDKGSQLFIWGKEAIFFPSTKVDGQAAFLHRIYPELQFAFFNEESVLTISI